MSVFQLLKAFVALAPLAAAEHRADLLVPRAGQSHAAFRYDTEVFGWNADFSEVGCVCMEVVRGPQGRHRGEAYMLVYRLGEWLPKHNIICHNITHVDLPHNPVPLETAQDYLWVIEGDYLNMWPNRPIRRPRRGFMRAEPVVAMLPAALKFAVPDVDRPPPAKADDPALVRQARAAAEAEDAQALAAARAAPLAQEVRTGGPEASCRPWVGFVLHYRGKTALQAFVPLDMEAPCALLRADAAPRTYWGKADVAASMVRVDFARQPDNEESARFLASAAWRLGERPTLRLQAALPPAKVHQLARQVAQMGGQLRPAPRPPAAAALQARGARRWLAWAAYLAQRQGLDVRRFVVDEAAGATLTLAPFVPGQDDRLPLLPPAGGGAPLQAVDSGPRPVPHEAAHFGGPPAAPSLPAGDGDGDGDGADAAAPGGDPLDLGLEVAPAAPAPQPPAAAQPTPPAAPPAPRVRSQYLEDWRP